MLFGVAWWGGPGGREGWVVWTSASQCPDQPTLDSLGGREVTIVMAAVIVEPYRVAFPLEAL